MYRRVLELKEELDRVKVQAQDQAKKRQRLARCLKISERDCALAQDTIGRFRALLQRVLTFNEKHPNCEGEWPQIIDAIIDVELMPTFGVSAHPAPGGGKPIVNLVRRKEDRYEDFFKLRRAYRAACAVWGCL